MSCGGFFSTFENLKFVHLLQREVLLNTHNGASCTSG